MIRGKKDVDWSKYLSPDDILLLSARIEPDGWYPMESFERMGIAILREVAHNQLDGVQMWGRFQVLSIRARHPDLVVEGSAIETLVRFRVMTRSFFDYAAIEVVSLNDEDALVAIAFKMGDLAEETACNQTLGFFVGMLDASGATNVHARFLERSWQGSSHTLIDLRWSAA